MYIYTHICVYIRVCIHIYIYIYIYIHIYVCMWSLAAASPVLLSPLASLASLACVGEFYNYYGFCCHFSVFYLYSICSKGSKEFYNARPCGSGEAAAIRSFGRCKPAACILGLTGANTRLSLICGFP